MMPDERLEEKKASHKNGMIVWVLVLSIYFLAMVGSTGYDLYLRHQIKNGRHKATTQMLRNRQTTHQI